MNKRLTRLFLTYPFHSTKKEAAQKLLDFPLQFYSEDPNLLGESLKTPLLPEHTEEIVKGYRTLLKSFAHDNFNYLLGSTESTFVKKMSENWANYREQGYRAEIVGTQEDLEIYLMDDDVFHGAVLPYRNLNLPYKEYFRFRPPTSMNASLFVYAGPRKRLPFRELQELDLKKISYTEDMENYSEKIRALLVYLNRFNISIRAIDFGIYTSLKLNILDSTGKLVEGNPDPLAKEFHCLRAEMLFPPPYWVDLLSFWRFGKFIKKQFPEIFEKFSIIDIDGYMDKNLPIKFPESSK